LIRSNAFAGKSLLDRHRLVEKTLNRHATTGVSTP